MRIRSVLWSGLGLLGAGAVAYGVSCVNNNATDTTCPSYCQAVATTCEGGLAQYPDDPTCERICGAMAPGEAGMPAGDTVACRSFWVGTATDDLPGNVYGDCVNAGPSSKACPDQCTSFCNLTMTLCGTDRNGYTDVNDCISKCHTWPVGAGDTAAFNGQLIGTTGNNLQCRTYHLELSQKGATAMDVTNSETVHCPHTGEDSALCKDPDGGADAQADAPADASGD